MTRYWHDADVEKAIEFSKNNDPITWNRYIAFEKGTGTFLVGDVDHFYLPLQSYLFRGERPTAIAKLVERIRDRVREDLGIVGPKRPMEYLPPKDEWTPRDVAYAIEKLKAGVAHWYAGDKDELWHRYVDQEVKRGGPDWHTTSDILLFLGNYVFPGLRNRFYVPLVEGIRDKVRAELGLHGPRERTEGLPLERLWTRADVCRAMDDVRLHAPGTWEKYLHQERETQRIDAGVGAALTKIIMEHTFPGVSHRDVDGLISLIRPKVRHDTCGDPLPDWFVRLK